MSILFSFFFVYFCLGCHRCQSSTRRSFTLEIQSFFSLFFFSSSCHRSPIKHRLILHKICVLVVTEARSSIGWPFTHYTSHLYCFVWLFVYFCSGCHRIQLMHTDCSGMCACLPAPCCWRWIVWCMHVSCTDSDIHSCFEL